MTATVIDTELVALYVEESGLSEYVVTAFLAEDTEPPKASRVDRIGYTVAERAILAKASTPATADLPFEGVGVTRNR